ncbi:PTS transporter subunit EIIC [Paenibacillus sp. GCM10027627]|uniref:PTS transporter subunit EIIC n=1 Tax=unclassified Paenibacillus TaxID=185978 RepID=UPI00364582D2
MSYIQRIGRSFMIPIAVMPAAALLQRFGKIEFDHPILQQIAAICEAGGGAIFDHLPLLFAIGIAIGLTQGKGVAALSAAVGYTVFQEVMKTFEASASSDLAGASFQMGVLGGMITGGVTAYLYNRFKDVQLPQALGFFSGRRFVPIVTALTMTVLGGSLGFIWMPIQEGILAVGLWLQSTGGIGTFIYGTINRLLIPTGLHHIVNNILWFQVGEYATAGGKVVQGDLTRFFAGDPTAGTYMAGFFPIMMFGLPGAAIAMAQCARPENRKVIMSIMLSAALTSFLTGVTEPIEFAFMLVAPLLFFIHAVLTGLSMMIMHLLEVKIGFGFSAGFIDLAINWHYATNPWLIPIVGAAYFVLYYFTFYIVIRAFNLSTPGRAVDKLEAPIDSQLNSEAVATETDLLTIPEALEASPSASGTGHTAARSDSTQAEAPAESIPGTPPAQGASGSIVPSLRMSSTKIIAQKSTSVIEFIGGYSNILEIDACITRLRLTLREPTLVKEQSLKDLGAAGIIRIGKQGVHVVFGTDSELIKEEVQKQMAQDAKPSEEVE